MADISEAMVEAAKDAALREGAFLGEDMVRYMLEAALSAAPASAQMEGWWPIETAPKNTSYDGLRADIWLEPIPERQALFANPATEGRRLTNAWFVERSDYTGWRNDRSWNGRELNWRATHWRPVPAAPLPTSEGSSNG